MFRLELSVNASIREKSVLHTRVITWVELPDARVEKSSTATMKGKSTDEKM